MGRLFLSQLKIIHYFRNMNETQHDIDELLRLVQNKLGRSLTTPSDFDALTLAVSQLTGDRLSISTVKRLVGYVNDSHSPSNATLSILSRYVGYCDWTAFKNRLNDTTSGSLNEEIIQTDHLTVGDEIELEWLPDRHCCLRYLGETRFEVVAVSGTEHLSRGDTFNAMVFGVGQPLMATNHQHGDETKPLYVAGRTHGLSRLVLHRK